MKYLGLGYFNKEKMDTLPKEKMDAIMLECQAHLEELYKSGQVLADAGVAQEVKSLQRVDGRIEVRNGHLNQPEKMIGSAFIPEARSDKLIEKALKHAIHYNEKAVHFNKVY